MMLPCLFLGIQVWLSKRPALPRGFVWLLIWTVFILLFVPNSPYLARNISYGTWLLFNVGLVLSTSVLLDTREKFERVFRWYIRGFTLMAVFGLIQFCLPLLHIAPPLVTEWWFPGVLPRVNGFSFEPSYYATYMIAGLVLTDYLTLNARKYRMQCYLIGLALLVSSSRLGWGAMLVWFVIRSVIIFRRAHFLHHLSRLSISRRFAKQVVITVVLICGVGLTSAYSGLDFESLRFMIVGLGLAGEASHSVDQRIDDFARTLEVFKEHPIIGVSLGGVATHIAILRGEGADWVDESIAHLNEGMCVTAEVLAASGVIAFPFFIAYLWSLFRPRCCRIHPVANGLRLSLLAMFLMLQFNQNILRFSFWFHVGLLCAAYNVFANDRQQSQKLS